MQFGICTLSAIPVRVEPTENSPMLTQILFGEHYSIIYEFMGWLLITLEFDQSEGWIDSRMASPISARTFNRICSRKAAVCTSVLDLIDNQQEQLMIMAGSSLPLWRPIKKEFSLGQSYYLPSGEFNAKPIKDLGQFIIQRALMYFNVPHLSGGRSPFGIDASGLIQIIFKMALIQLPRSLKEQVHHGEVLSFIAECQNGDVAFFQDEQGEINHAGFIWEKNKIIHVSGTVRIDNIDQHGIYNTQSRRYTHDLRVIKRIGYSN
ncbi:MAG: NlpC/P60 family protein [Mangrovibacterium sp.]